MSIEKITRARFCEERRIILLNLQNLFGGKGSQVDCLVIPDLSEYAGNGKNSVYVFTRKDTPAIER